MEIDGKTRVLGLIGDPVEHTLSPLIHQAIARAQGQNTVYVPFRVVSDELCDAVRGGVALGILGLNVTVPHKEAVVPYLKGMDNLAENIGAVNTLALTESGEGYRGYNTDALGFKRQLEEIGISLLGKEAIVIGAGGASKAICYALLLLGVTKIYLLNRSADKAHIKFQNLEREGRMTVLPLGEWHKIPRDRYFCAQCTSVGLSPKTDLSPIEDPDFFELVGCAVDIIYNPPETKFMKLVKSHGGEAYNGLSMLLYQAVESYSIFTGKRVSQSAIDIVRGVLEEAVWGE